MIVDEESGKSSPPSIPPVLARPHARRPVFRLFAITGVLMTLAGTAFAMCSQGFYGNVGGTRSEARDGLTSSKDVPRARGADEAATKSTAAAGPSSSAEELKFSKDPKPAAKSKPKAKARAKQKTTKRHHA